MYKRILVPLDGSARAERILKHAEDLALSNKAHLILLQIVQPEVIGDGYKGVLVEQSKQATEQRISEAESYLNRTAAIFRGKGIECHTIVETGTIATGILRVAEREAVDLIAMASHGRSGLARVFYGSVAAGVLQQVDRPLLLIRARQD
jgi:nucleotide-binding universal stress UspA family protein